MAREGSVKRYWSGIKNVHKRLNNTDSDGVSARRKYYELTGRKIYKENNFQKSLKRGKSGISLKIVRKDFKRIRERKVKLLAKEYKTLQKEQMILDSKNAFIKNNLHDDQEWQDIRELFNSP